MKLDINPQKSVGCFMISFLCVCMEIWTVPLKCLSWTGTWNRGVSFQYYYYFIFYSFFLLRTVNETLIYFLYKAVVQVSNATLKSSLFFVRLRRKSHSLRILNFQ